MAVVHCTTANTLDIKASGYFLLLQSGSILKRVLSF